MAALAGCAVATGAVAASQVTAQTGGSVIYACKAKKGGALRVVTKKAKCGKSATKISWNTTGATSPSLVAFTQVTGPTLHPGATWVTLATTTLTAVRTALYQPLVYISRSQKFCGQNDFGTVPYTAETLVTRTLVNGTALPNPWNEDGTYNNNGNPGDILLQAWSGPVTLTLIGRLQQGSSETPPVVPPCTLDPGTIQFGAYAYSK